MNFDPSLPNDSRRNFVKKSLAASIIAAQPTILAGLIRAQGGGGGTGTTDPWGTTGNGETGTPWYSEWDDTGVGVTETPPPPVLEPSIRKQDAEAEETPVSVKSVAFGTITASENKGTVQNPDWVPKFQGKIYWLLEASLKISSAPKQGEFIIPVKAECFNCTAEDIKLKFLVEKVLGTAQTLATSLTNDFNEQLGTSFNNGNENYVECPDLTYGVSATAIADPNNAQGALISMTDPGSKESPQNQNLRVKLDPSVNPAQNSASKTVEWTFSAVAGPNITQGIKDALKAIAESAIHEHNSEWKLQGQAIDLPPFGDFDEIEKPSQSGTAQKLQNVALGAACPAYP